MSNLAPALWADLPATPYKEHGRTPGVGLDCWGLAREVFRRAGVELPAAPEESQGWHRVSSPETGCLVLMDLDGRRHCAIALGEDKILHATREAGVAVTRLSAAEAAGVVVGYFWPGDAAIPIVRDEAEVGTVVVWLDPISGERTIEHQPDGWEPPPGVPVVARSGRFVVLARSPGEFNVVLFVIGLVISIVGALISRPSLPKPKDQPKDDPSPAYDLSGYLRNTSGVGVPQPIVYGTHRTGGHIISAFQRSDAEGRSVLYMLLALSRGPVQAIGGITTDTDGLTGSAIPSTILIDGNPASSYNCTVSVRMGNSDQDPIPGFRETVNVTGYSMTLLVGNPFTHVGISVIQSFEVVLSFPLGLYNINVSNGNVGSRTVTLTIRHRLIGASTWTSNTWTITNATRAAFSRTFRLDNLTAGKYEIQVERISPVWPEGPLDHESRSDLVEIHEITNDALSYPGMALLGLKAVATDQLNGGIPNVNALVQGRKVYVWDGVSTTSPSFTEAYSDNPAWVLMDALIHPHYGLARGGRLTLNNIDLAAFKVFADNCDTLVSDGRGGTTKRAVCDLVVDTTQSGWELCNAIALSHWGQLVMVGRKISIVTMKVATPVYAFTMGNVSDVVVTYLGRKQRPNAVDVAYFNEETNYEADTATKYDEAAIVSGGEAVVRDSIQAVGVTRAAQAYRLAQYRLNYAKLSKRRVRFDAGLEALHLLPGDTIWFTHDAIDIGVSGRLIGVSSKSVFQLDRDLDASSGTVKLMIKTDADSVEERTVTPGVYARGEDVSVTSAFTATPTVASPYAAGPTATYRQSYRITSIETTEDLRRRIESAEYLDAIHSDDPGDVEPFTDVMPDPRTMPTSVSNLRAQELEVMGADGGACDGIEVSWDPAERWQTAEVWVRSVDESNDEHWTYCGDSKQGRFTICCGIAGGSSYIVSVVAVAPRGCRLHPAQGTKASVYVRGRRAAPAAPSSVSAHVLGGILHVRVSEPSDTIGVAGYQIRYGGGWAGAALIADAAPAIFSAPCPFVGTQTVRVRSVNRAGVVSESEVTDSASFATPPGYYETDDQDENPGWTGTKTNTAVSGTALALSGSNLSGTYAAALTETGERRLITAFSGKLQNVKRTWEDCSFRWADAACAKKWNEFWLDGFECSEGLRWRDAHFRWSSLPAQCRRWSGPIDIVEALTPTVTVADGGGDTSEGPTVERSVTNPTVTVTLRRPHDSYEPELTTMATVLLGKDPEGVTFHFYSTSAIAVGSGAYGHITNSNATTLHTVPTGKTLKILKCWGTANTGATVGSNYDGQFVIRSGAGANTELARFDNKSENATVSVYAEGTMDAPLASFAAGSQFRFGFVNVAGSTGAWAAGPHIIYVKGVLI